MTTESKMEQLHTFRVISAGDRNGDGASEKTVQASGMGPLGSGDRVVGQEDGKRPLTVAEQISQKANVAAVLKAR